LVGKRRHHGGGKHAGKTLGRKCLEYQEVPQDKAKSTSLPIGVKQSGDPATKEGAIPLTEKDPQKIKKPRK